MVQRLVQRSGRTFLRPVHLVTTAALVSALLLGSQFAQAGASRAPGKAQAKSQAKKDLLVLADMPSGWKTEKGSGGGGNSNFPGAKQLASCIGVSSKLINSNPPEVDSPYFESSDGSLEVQDSVSVFGSAKVAKAELAAMANPKTPFCMTTIMNGAFKAKIAASAGKGASLGTITVTRANPATFAKGATGLNISLPITAQGQSLTVNISAVYYVKGTLGQQVDFNSYGSPFPSLISLALSSTAFNRL
jgi:hypothetical protein